MRNKLYIYNCDALDCPSMEQQIRNGTERKGDVNSPRIITTIIFALLFLSVLFYYLVCFRCLYNEIKVYI